MIQRTRRLRFRRIGLAAVGVLILVTATLVACRGRSESPAEGSPEGSPSPESSPEKSPTRSPTPAPGITAPAQVLPDRPYAHVSAAQRLDLHLPARSGVAVPLVIVIHGGAFALGDKTDEPGLVKAALRAGYAAATINYRLTGEARFPAGVQDAKAAVRWLRANAAKYGLDPGAFAVFGTSAGGTLAALLGTTSSIPSIFDDPALGHPQVSAAVQAVVDWYGPSDFRTMDRQAIDPGGCPGSPLRHDPAHSPESRWLGAPVQEAADAVQAASPITYLSRTATTPPFLLAHGLLDCTVPHGQSQQLAAALKRAGVPVTLTLVPKAGHADPVINQTQTEPAMAFLGRVFGR